MPIVRSQVESLLNHLGVYPEEGLKAAVLDDMLIKAIRAIETVKVNEIAPRPSSCSPRSIMLIAASIAVSAIVYLFSRTIGCNQALQVCETNTIKLQETNDNLNRTSTAFSRIIGCDQTRQRCETDTTKLQQLCDDLKRNNTELDGIANDCIDKLETCEKKLSESTDEP